MSLRLGTAGHVVSISSPRAAFPLKAQLLTPAAACQEPLGGQLHATGSCMDAMGKAGAMMRIAATASMLTWHAPPWHSCQPHHSGQLPALTQDWYHTDLWALGKCLAWAVRCTCIARCSRTVTAQAGGCMKLHHRRHAPASRRGQSCRSQGFVCLARCIHQWQHSSSSKDQTVSWATAT